jgi:hypothetical protein
MCRGWRARNSSLADKQLYGVGAGPDRLGVRVSATLPAAGRDLLGFAGSGCADARGRRSDQPLRRGRFAVLARPPQAGGLHAGQSLRAVAAESERQSGRRGAPAAHGFHRGAARNVRQSGLFDIRPSRQRRCTTGWPDRGSGDPRNASRGCGRTVCCAALETFRRPNRSRPNDSFTRSASLYGTAA